MKSAEPDPRGLSIEEVLAISWTPVEDRRHAVLEHANEESLRVLQALYASEDSHRPARNDMNSNPSESARIEAKVDLLLSLVGKLVTERFAPPEPRPLILRADSVEWQALGSHNPPRGAAGFVNIWLSAEVPLPLRLPAKISGGAERQGSVWWYARLESLSDAVSDGLQKLIFRHHRRQIAIARGTLVEPQGFA